MKANGKNCVETMMGKAGLQKLLGMGKAGLQKLLVMGKASLQKLLGMEKDLLIKIKTAVSYITQV